MWKNSSKSNVPKDDEKTQMMQIIRLIRPVFLYFYDTTNVDLRFSCTKLSLTLVGFKSEKVIILPPPLTTRAWRVVLVCPNSISVSVIINYTNMVATSHVKLGFLKSKFGHGSEDKNSAVSASFKGKLMQIPPYILTHIKIAPWKFRILKNCRVIYP